MQKAKGYCHTADQRLCFRFIDGILFESENSGLYRSNLLVYVEPCRKHEDSLSYNGAHFLFVTNIPIQNQRFGLASSKAMISLDIDSVDQFSLFQTMKPPSQRTAKVDRSLSGAEICQTTTHNILCGIHNVQPRKHRPCSHDWCYDWVANTNRDAQTSKLI